MHPNFSKKTVDTLAKRAAYRCSNPDCRALTVGPNDEHDKATVIGEAAHIFAARPDGPRFKAEMTDAARGEITNGIWLCRNCHRKVDQNSGQFTSDLLFAWRENHEKHVNENLGQISDQLTSDLLEKEMQQFAGYPAIIRRIVIDKPQGWEWTLTAELFRYLNYPEIQRLRDLRDGLYTRPTLNLDPDEALNWLENRRQDMLELIAPLSKLLDRLTDSWGDLGEPGDIDQIHRVNLLMKDAFARIVDHEEALRFARTPDDFEPLRLLLTDAVGTQTEKFAEIPEMLESTLATALEKGSRENPLVVRKTITIELPDNFVKDFGKAYRRAEKATYEDVKITVGGNGWNWFFFIVMALIGFALVF